MQRELGRDWVAEVNYVGNYGSQIADHRATSTRRRLQYLSTSPTSAIRRRSTF